jgi:hypothetical protein
MTRTKRALVAVGFLTAAGGLALLLLTGGPADLRNLWISSHEAAATCRASVVELDFDPEGHIEARAGGKTVASADIASRRVSHDACAKTPVPQAFSQGGVRYARMTTRVTLSCRFPGLFGVHVYPVSASWSGERPAGSAVGLVLERRLGTGPGPRRTILASATVLRRSDDSDVVFVRRYCTAATTR